MARRDQIASKEHLASRIGESGLAETSPGGRFPIDPERLAGASVLSGERGVVT